MTQNQEFMQIIYFGFLRAISLAMAIAMMILGKDNGFYWFGVGMLIFRETMLVWIQGLPEDKK